jgi:kynurenine formamidase
MTVPPPLPTPPTNPDGALRGKSGPQEPNNWNRWGALDERGTANFIDPAMIAHAATLITTGHVISCAVPLDFATTPVPPDRPPPIHYFTFSGVDFLVEDAPDAPVPDFHGADDYVTMALQTGTHWDGLAHAHHEDTLYNGYWIGNTSSYAGARRCSIDQISPGIIGRGVLLDLPRHAGIERLTPGHVISVGELVQTARAEQVRVGRGDILLLRTGHLAWYYSLADKAEFWAAGAPGIGADVVAWLHETEVAALAADNATVEVVPSETGDLHPLHPRLIRDLGMTIGELWWLDELADACAHDGRYDFFLSAPPLRIQGAVGSPVNPIAIK